MRKSKAMRKLKNNELERLSVDDFKQAKKIPMILVLDNIRSLHNVGSVFRTADGLLLQGIYLCGITATPPHREIHKTALGAPDSVAWEYFKETADAVLKLKEEGYTIVSVEQAENSTMLQDFMIDAEKKYALVFGNEVKGVKQEVVNLSDICLEIPQYGTKHSFNVSVTAGMVLWDLFKQWKYR